MAKNTLISSFSVRGKIEKNWRPEVAIWRLKIFVQSPVGANIKKLISDPVYV